MIYLVEVTGAAAGGATTVFRYSTKGYVTLPTDTPLFWQLVADLLLPMIAHTQDAALETDA